MTSVKTNNLQLEGEGPAPPQASARKSRAEHILDTTAILLLRWGFRKTTIDDVAREAGVAKGTIYLHWKSKQELFVATILRAQQQTSADVQLRISADPDGGLLHRLWTHGMLAALANPLMAAIISGKTDALVEMRSAFAPEIVHQITGDYEEYITQLQQAGRIRADLSAPVISFVTSALKVGLINTPELLGQEPTPPTEQLIAAFSDLIQRWLAPGAPAATNAVGKQFAAELVEKLNIVEEQLQQTE